ncbi:hypothetical protein [Stenotrophomonas maltophilia]|uniref:hypothetical protein n=1 Tax=Stenotrophomonas maltophilia TaxID=40324 RepID=UPI002B1CF020|nr:hypothetical protein [Stenotrophomonas maltophilia]
MVVDLARFRMVRMVAEIGEFLRDPLVVAVLGGVLLAGLYWSLVFVLRGKGAGNGR